MEGSVEKFEKPIKDEKIDELSESELADIIEINRKERRLGGDAYQPEIKEELINLFENAYFETLNKIDDLSENISDKELKEKFNFDMDKLREYADGFYPYIMERINILYKGNNIKIASNNSFRDVLSNSFFNGLTNVKWFRENFPKKNKNEIIREKIDNPKSGRRKNLNNFSRLLNSKDLEYYVRGLCINEEQLKMEVEIEQGYISKFSDFFMENEKGKIYPSGSKKLSYFRFFSEAEKWKNGRGDQIKNRTDFRRALADLDPSEKFIIKDKIRRYFLNK